MNVERKKWYHKLLRPLLNALALKGVSGCFICGDRWNWKMEHPVKFTDREAAFPVCEECWETKDSLDIVNAANHLAALWIEQIPISRLTATRAHANVMIEAVKTAAYARVYIGEAGYAERA